MSEGKSQPNNTPPNYLTKSGKQLVYFAAERTLMAWVRTALGMMALGFVIDRFGLVIRTMSSDSHLHPQAFSFWAGTILVIAGSVMATTAVVRYLMFAVRYHREGATEPGRGLYLGVFFAALVAIMGIIIAVFLVSVTR